MPQTRHPTVNLKISMHEGTEVWKNGELILVVCLYKRYFISLGLHFLIVEYIPSPLSKGHGKPLFLEVFSSVSPRVAFHAAKAWVWHVLLLTVCWTPGHVQNLLKNNRRSDLTMVLRAFSNLPPLFELTKWKHENELKALSLPNRERL